MSFENTMDNCRKQALQGTSSAMIEWVELYMQWLGAAPCDVEACLKTALFEAGALDVVGLLANDQGKDEDSGLQQVHVYMVMKDDETAALERTERTRDTLVRAAFPAAVTVFVSHRTLKEQREAEKGELKGKWQPSRFKVGKP